MSDAFITNVMNAKETSWLDPNEDDQQSDEVLEWIDPDVNDLQHTGEEATWMD